MNYTLQYLLNHGYSVLFAWVLVEQAGVPIPSAPILLAAGALVGFGRMTAPPLLDCLLPRASSAIASGFPLDSGAVPRSWDSSIAYLLARVSA